MDKLEFERKRVKLKQNTVMVKQILQDENHVYYMNL